MVFSQPVFLLFFAVMLLLYAGTRNYRERAAVILTGSLIFYASWKPAYLVLLVVSVTLNYWIYSALAATRSKRLLIIGLILNLGFLGLAKYAGMLLQSVFELGALLKIPLSVTPAWADWALPLGISFYTFHMLSVMIDVYRGEWTQRISFRAWWLYVSFFPHMIAGPILRASELVEQLETLAPLRAADIKLGALIFMAGLVKKVSNLTSMPHGWLPLPLHFKSTLIFLATVKWPSALRGCSASPCREIFCSLIPVTA
jgi:alginate O-acetyltransferase complex protein AlgI